jgi:hypothetical protein
MGCDTQMFSVQLTVQLPGCLAASVTSITTNSELTPLCMALSKKTPALRIAPENLLVSVPSQFSHPFWTTLKMQVSSSSKTLVRTYQSTRRHVLKPRNNTAIETLAVMLGVFPKTKLKRKAISVQVMKAYKCRGGIAALIRNLGTRWRTVTTEEHGVWHLIYLLMLVV